ncbi:MAG: histidine phosphatase family protein [Pseudomonadota bacterium]
MGKLTLVRHGQASLGADDYDRLSDLGRQQSRLLGRYWAEQGRSFDRVVVGPLRRHRETHEEVVTGFREAGGELPEATGHEALCEHQAVEVVRRVIEGESDAPKPSGDLKHAWFRHFDRIMRNWIGGSIHFDDLENWQQARDRVRGAIPQLVEPADVDTLAITSGGFVCMMIGDVLDLDDVPVYELALELRNAAWAELRLSSIGPRLMAFNAHPHLAEQTLQTLV